MMRAIRVTEGPLITPRLIFGRSKGSVSGYFQQNNLKYYSIHASGRAALFEGLKRLGFRPDDNALLPAYVCNAATIPFRKLGIPMRFYNILPSLEPDMDDITRKVNGKTKAIMIVDYFGFPQVLGPVRELCKKQKLFLIEDNSHGTLSNNGSQLLGTFGDIGFSSIYKELPTPNGGVLFINNDAYLPETPNPLTVPGYSLISDGFFFLSSLLKSLEANFRLPTWILRNMYRKTHPQGESIGDKAIFLDASISRITVKVMEKVNPVHIINRRRENYNAWLKKVNGRKEIKVIFETLPEGVCPWMFPLVVEDGKFIEEIRSQGIAGGTWPHLPLEVQGMHDHANYLARHLYTLPVHQGLNPKYLI